MWKVYCAIGKIATEIPAIASQTLLGDRLITAPAWGGHLELFTPLTSQTTH